MEFLYIIDTLKSIYEGKCIEDIGNMKRNIEKFCKQNNLQNKQYKGFTITIQNNNLSLHDRTRQRELYLNYTGFQTFYTVLYNSILEINN